MNSIETLVNYGPNETTRERFEARCQEVDPTRTDITTWVMLQDVDDQLSFGIIDLNRRAPRSPLQHRSLRNGSTRTVD